MTPVFRWDAAGVAAVIDSDCRRFVLRPAPSQGSRSGPVEPRTLRWEVWEGVVRLGGFLADAAHFGDDRDRALWSSIAVTIGTGPAS